MTHDLLEDLVRDAPRHVVPDVDAAWRSGARRRRRSMALRVATGAALAAVVAVGVLGFDGRQSVAPAGGDKGVGSHPSFVPRPLLMTNLPERPGPVAGVLNTGDDVLAVVAEDGRSWRLPGLSGTDYVPSLSDDGRLLGYMEMLDDEKSQFVILDLVTGERTEFPDIGDNMGDSGQPYMMIGQLPSYWSSDGQWLLADGYPNRGHGQLLLGADGEVRSVRDRGRPVGWIGDDRLGWLSGPDQLVVTDLDGSVLARVELDAAPRGLREWTGRLSSDGSELAVVPRGSDGGVVTVYDVDTGQVNGRGLGSAGQFSDLVWFGEYEPTSISPTGIAGVTRLGLVDTSSGNYVIEYSERWGAVPGVWARDSLTGDESSGPGLLDWRYWQWPWWLVDRWTWIVVGLTGVAALIALRRLLRRGRSKPQGTDAVDWWGGNAA